MHSMETKAKEPTLEVLSIGAEGEYLNEQVKKVMRDKASSV